MNLQQKIESEIIKLEEVLNNSHEYQTIKALEEKLKQLPTYQTLQTLKSLLIEPSQEYKILDRGGYTTSPRRSPKIRLDDTSHYKEMLDYIELYLETRPDPQTINTLYDMVVSEGYEVGGKRPAYTLSACLSRDTRFTPTNKGWILSKNVQDNNS